MTNELRKVVESRLNNLKTTYNIAEIAYRQGQVKEMYPHLVFDVVSCLPTDHGRHDYTIDVHVWTKDQYQAFEIADAVAGIFAYTNLPQEAILPTFYESNIVQVEDPDVTICHLVVRMEGQIYMTTGGGEVWQQ